MSHMEEGICPACSGSGEGQFEGSTCGACKGSGVEWVEVEDEGTDWNNIPVDTLVWVSHVSSCEGTPRHFYKVVDGKPRVFNSGRSSKTVAAGDFDGSAGDVRDFTTAWEYMSLTKMEG